MPHKIDRFEGEYRWLSNFWPIPIPFEGITYPSVEHAYQAAKTTDKGIRFHIVHCGDARAAKRAGKSIALRPDWDKLRLDIMLGLLWEKFHDRDEEHHVLAQKLRETGDAELIEGNWWGDTFWGVCSGRGSNHLGRLLMLVRDEIRDGCVMCNGVKGGVPGNENIINGLVMCDYCSAARMRS